MANTKITKTTQIKNLDAATQFIQVVEEGTRRNLYAIASALAIVDQNKLYEEKEYKSTAEYGEAVHGYKRATTSALVRVAYRFIDGSNSRFKIEDEKDFTIYQLMELLPMEDSQIETCIENGELNPYMTTKSIRDLVKSYKVIPEKTKESKEASKPEVEEVSKPEVEEASKPEVEEASKPEVEEAENIRIHNAGIDAVERNMNALLEWVKLTTDPSKEGAVDLIRETLRVINTLRL